MARTTGAKGKRTLIREENQRRAAEEAAKTAGATQDPQIMVDCLTVMEEAMRYFRGRALAERGKPEAERKEDVIRAAYLDAAAIAEKAAPYRHYKLAAVKVQGDLDKNKGLDNATADQLKSEIMAEMLALGLGPMPSGVANRSRPASQNN